MRSTAIVAALVAATLATAVDARVAVTTVRGTVGSGTDGLGLFGAAGADLAGKTFTEVFTVDDSVGGRGYDIAGLESGISGGSSFGAPDPVVGTFTIGHHTVAVSGQFFADAYQYDDGTLSQAEYRVQSWDGVTNAHMTFLLNHPASGAFPVDLWQPLDYQTVAGDTSNGLFQYQVYSDSMNFTYTQASLSPQRYTITVGTAPEPGAWALMITGLGLTGAAARRRSRVIVA